MENEHQQHRGKGGEEAGSGDDGIVDVDLPVHPGDDGRQRGGAGFGDNTKAALQPRGLAEIARLGRIFDADPLTFAGLSGMGDLIVTCMSRHSRNRFVGEQIGRGKTLQQVLDEMVMVAEGVRTCKSAVALAEKHHIDMPISREVYSVLFNNKEPKKAMEDLMGREVKPEVWF